MPLSRFLLAAPLAATVIASGLCIGSAHAALASPADADAASANLVQAPLSVDPTGLTDATASMNAFLAQVPDGSTVELLPGAHYRMDGTLTVTDRHDLVIDGNGATLTTSGVGAPGRDFVTVTGGSDLVVRDLAIRGTSTTPGQYKGATYETQHGIVLSGVQRARLENLSITNVRGDFVYLGRDQRSKVASYRQPTTDVVVTGSRFDGSGRQGIAMTVAQRVLISDNTLNLIPRSTFDLEPNSPESVVSDVTIANNVVSNGHLKFVAAAGGGVVKNVMVSGNRGSGKALTGWISNKGGYGRSNFTFANNTSDRSFASPQRGVVYAIGVSNIAYVNNVQPVDARRHMAGLSSVSGTCGARAAGNTMVNAERQVLGGTAPCAGGSAMPTPVLPTDVSTS